DATRRMAVASFGDGRLLLEKYLDDPRHVEIQVAADGHGRTVHLFERECSVQRRFQKLIEETPSMALTEELREEMGRAAVRIAEDPAKNFMPNPGTITRWDEPGGPHVRLDSGVAPRSVVSFHYDPLLAKLIVWAGDRPLAIRRMQRALAEFKVEGLKTTIPFHRAALAHPAFVSGNYNTEIAASVKLA